MSGHGKVVKHKSKSKDKVLKRKLFTYSEESLKEALKHIRLGEKQQKKSKVESKLNYDTEKERIKCSLCEDELISETEEDSEKNIGCDHCSRWYHLRCTEFGEHAFEDVASKDYICDICK